MFTSVREEIQKELQEIKEAGLYKEERIITTPQKAEINTEKGSEVLNFCANNYLGLSSQRPTGTGCLPFALSVVRKIFIKN